MKKHLFLMLLMFLSCGQVDQEKPENLIGEEKMSDLIFELALFDASKGFVMKGETARICLLYTSPSPRDTLLSRMPSSA